MTKALPFTQASIRRAVEGARKAGLRVVGIAPNGTVLTDDGTGDRNHSILAPAPPSAAKWEDVEA